MWGRHSTQRGSWAALALSLLAVPAALGADDAWLDIEGRIQYAYYTEDLRSLANLAQSLTAGTDADPLRDYYLGLAYYRIALLSSARAANRPRNALPAGRVSLEDAAELCVASLERLLTKRPEFVEALALQSACLNTLGELKPLRAPLAESRSRAHIQRAARLAPSNPRVLLIQAAAVNSDQGPLLRRAIVLFEAARQSVNRAPDWGAADAYVQLGGYYLNHGEVLPARDALEHALLLAPEFALARRLLARITTG